MAISKRLRFEILRRDGFKCRYCHRDQVIITVDHVIPVALGGSDHPTNLVASCDDCNAGKTSALPGGQTVEDVNNDLMRWARALKRAARGDWQARETEAVVNAAAHVWQSYWMPEHQANPTPELIADFRRKALELYPEEFGADDLMLAAQACAEQGIADLRDALDFAQLLDRLPLAEGEFDRSVVNMAVCIWEREVTSGGRPPRPSEMNTVRESAAALYPNNVGAGPIIRAAYDVAQWGDTDLSHGLGRDDFLEVKPFHLLVASSFFRGQAENDPPEPIPIGPDGWTNVLRQAFAARDAGYNEDAVLQGAYFSGRHGSPLASQMTTAGESLKSIGGWYAAELKECALSQEELDRLAAHSLVEKAENDQRAAERAAAGDPQYSWHPAHPSNAVTNGVSHTNGDV